ncbi:kinase-like domain protein [Fusarium subglutinans]|uniref:Kinase-like domain protein n=1 Tax=Gibberella subglutinans TaxID=42677 RepID=A0A8H5V0V7_GIBSU|nr:kinase-like domain protein [Fusarium subglutinans]KAF5606707.1 kinase-like domain protein [Fusarium subglutinans]
MAENQSSLEQALAAIRNFGFQHPDDQLLECFLCDSVDPETTARYVLRKYCGQQEDLSLALLLYDWKELLENVIEQFTHKAKTEGDIVATNRSLKQFRELFGIFVGSDLQKQIHSHDVRLGGVQNHWLVRQSAAKALAQGYFRFASTRGSDYRVSQVTIGGPNRPSIVDKISTLRRGRFMDHSNSGIETPEISLLLATSRFFKSICWSLVGQEIASRPKQSTKSTLLSSPWPYVSEYVALAFASICRLMPAHLRIRIYQSLKLLGVRTYGPSSSLKVQQLPFGMYLKTMHRDDYQALANEFGALRLVRDQTKVPVPRPLDLVCDADASYLVTTTMPGQRLGSYIDVLSDDDLDTFKRDMQKYMAQLRSISRQGDQRHAISNAVGGPCYDYRIVACRDYDKERGHFFGPFTDEEEFNNTLRTPALPDVFHSTGHDIVSTHSDINMRNILMHKGRISGIVDWENSGWFPDYWEYTKAHYVTKLNKRWLTVVDRIFANFGDFKVDLAIERRLWEYCF